MNCTYGRNESRQSPGLGPHGDVIKPIATRDLGNFQSFSHLRIQNFLVFGIASARKHCVCLAIVYYNWCIAII